MDLRLTAEQQARLDQLVEDLEAAKTMTLDEALATLGADPPHVGDGTKGAGS